MMLNLEEKRRLCEILKMFHILLQLQLLIIAGAHPSFARDVFLLIFYRCVIIRVITVMGSTKTIKIIIKIVSE